MREGRFVQAAYEGETYQLPEYWLIGFTQDGRRSIADAVATWAMWERMDDEEEVREDV